MTDPTYKWTRVLSIPNGHRYFRDELSGRVSVCDDSGRKPDHTDDGVLWLDPRRPIVVEDLQPGGNARGWIPVTSPSGDQSCTIENLQGSIKVAHLFGYRVELRDSVGAFVRELFQAIANGIPISCGKPWHGPEGDSRAPEVHTCGHCGLYVAYPEELRANGGLCDDCRVAHAEAEA
jgi:hypothetical protein